MKHLLACALTVLGGACVAQAGLLDIAFYSSAFGGTQPTGPAVLGQAGDLWNWIDAGNPGGSTDTNYGPIAVSDTAGNPSGSLSFMAEGGVTSVKQGTQPDPDLTNNYLFNNTGGSIDVTLDGLAANQNYLLVMYVASNDAAGGARSLVGTVNGAPFAATGNAQTTFIDGENIVELNVTSDASGAITIAENGAGNSSGEVDFNGLQLQTSSVPEPASLSLLCCCLGVMGLLASRRERRRRAMPS